MNKNIVYGKEARDKLKRGVDALANAVGVTLGPKGRNVIIGNDNTSIITKDGVSVAKEIYLTDPVENMGAQMVKEVAELTNKKAGDGTTTATVLAQAILNKGYVRINNNVEPIDIKKQLDLDLIEIVKELNKRAVSIKDDYVQIRQIAKVSTNGDDELATLITDLIKKTNDPNILLEVSNTKDTYSEFVEGMSFTSSYIDSWFVNSPNRECILDNPYILIYNGKINSSKALLPTLELANAENRPIVIIAEQVNQETLLTLMRNKTNGLESVILNAPGFGPGRQEALQDIAIHTGGEVLNETQLKSITVEQLGQVSQIVVKEEKTLIKKGKGDKEEIKRRIEDLELTLPKLDDFTRSKTEQRISKFKGGLGVIYIGANSELEYKEKYHRIEDAVNAVKAALVEGIISGGGTTLYQIAEEANSHSVLYEAIRAPYLKIKSNAGQTEYNPEIEYSLFKSAGIIDPKKVTRCALENAVSVVGTILTTECVIVNE